jgi:hypothetical protein
VTILSYRLPFWRALFARKRPFWRPFGKLSLAHLFGVLVCRQGFSFATDWTTYWTPNGAPEGLTIITFFINAIIILLPFMLTKYENGHNQAPPQAEFIQDVGLCSFKMLGCVHSRCRVVFIQDVGLASFKMSGLLHSRCRIGFIQGSGRLHSRCRIGFIQDVGFELLFSLIRSLFGIPCLREKKK